MLKRPFKSVIARIAIVALALSLVFPFIPAALADSHSTSVSYAENGVGPVATFSATDQDGDAIEWSLSGQDAEDFTITGGVLAFKKSPNYEAPHSDSTGTQAEKNVYKVTVEATGGSHDVVVTVTNVDEDGVASLDQYQPQVGRSLVASVMDPDSDETNQEWQWARGESAEGPFTDIEDATDPSRAPTADDSGMYLRASVTYTDSFGAGKTASVVSDRAVESTTVANAAPSFEGQDQTGSTEDDDDGTTGIQDHIIISRSVDEGTDVGTAIGDPIRATDSDEDVLIYTLDWSPDLRTGSGTAASPSGDARFSIDRATGQLKVAKKLNYEAADGDVDRAETGALTADEVGGAIAVTDVTEDDAEYVLRVRATDPSGAYSNVNVTVTLNDANEAPTFAEATATPRTAVTVVEGTVALLEPGATADADPVALEANTFLATDQDTRVERPTDDTDTTADAIVSYAVEGADAKYFNIGTDATDTTTFGVLTIDPTVDGTTTGYMPNYEEQSSYSITIVATSGVDARRLAGRLDVTIKVTNAEDRGSVELSQIEPREGRIVTATLTDEDGNVNISTWQWQYVELQSGEVCNPGEGDTAPTGTWADIPKATSASYTPKDFVVAGATTDIANKCLRATATYTDGIDHADDTVTPAHTEPDTATQATDAVVQVAGATNSAPSFPDQDLTMVGDQSDETSRSVAENTPAKMGIGSAVDADDDDGDLRLYSLSGPDADSFGINRKTGQIMTKAKLDFETKDTYIVIVTATDPSGANDSITVTINVTDENDDAEITGSSSIDYAENGVGPVATFSATDQDGDAIEWSLSGQDAEDFTITGGVLAFKKSPNYEAPHSDSTGTQAEKNVYKVTVEATGGSHDVVVTVTNVDEDGVASLDQYQPQVGRSLVASVMDPDSDETNQEWQWARGESAEGPFTDIEDATDPSRAPTADDSGMYLRASVTYTDSFGAGKTASVVSDRAVESTTVANAAPSFEGQDQTGSTEDDDDGTTGIQDHIIISRSVDEGTDVGTAIGDPIRATDSDGDVLIYTLDWSPDLRTGSGTAASPSGDARFSIDRATGQLKVAKKLNYEAADGDVDRAETGALTADEVGGAIAVTDVTEDDAEYVLRVRATDPSGAYSNVNVTVTLNDANEAPTFAEATATPRTAVTVVEGTVALLEPGATADADPVALEANTFLATDQDTRVERPTDDTDTTADAIVSYAVEGADAKYFNIGTDATDTTTFGVLTIDPTVDGTTTGYMPNYEEQSSYSITIVATSGVDARRLAGRLDVTIKVTNAEDRGSVELSQIEPREGRIVTATLTDEDGNVNISTWQWQYVELQSGEVCNPGEGDTAPTGTWADIPKATSASYTPKDFVVAGATTDIANKCLRATATYTDGIDHADDTVTPAHTEPDTATQATDAVVQVAGATNSAPSFPDQDLTMVGDQSDETSRSVAENTPAKMGIGSAVDADDDDGDLRLYSLSGPDADSFGINRKTGQIMTKAKLDFETKDTYIVIVTATDPSGANDSITVTINVTDENDDATIVQVTEPEEPESTNNAPAFPADSVTRTVAENSEGGANVGDPVVATDEDEGDEVSYSLVDESGSFEIWPSGQITVAEGANLDFETQSSYTVTVTATDGTDSSSVEVTINIGNVGLASPYDADDNGEISKAEAVNAVQDYFDDEISREAVLEVIRIYFG